MEHPYITQWRILFKFLCSAFCAILSRCCYKIILVTVLHGNIKRSLVHLVYFLFWFLKIIFIVDHVAGLSPLLPLLPALTFSPPPHSPIAVPMGYAYKDVRSLVYLVYMHDAWIAGAVRYVNYVEWTQKEAGTWAAHKRQRFMLGP